MPWTPATGVRVGRPSARGRASRLDAILYIASTGCRWWQLPKETLQGYFYAWHEGRWETIINHALVMAEREKDGR